MRSKREIDRYALDLDVVRDAQVGLGATVWLCHAFGGAPPRSGCDNGDEQWLRENSVSPKYEGSLWAEWACICQLTCVLRLGFVVPSLLTLNVGWTGKGTGGGVVSTF